MKKRIAIFGFLVLTLFSCNSKTDKVKELCDKYNQQVPLKIDEATTLKGVTCTDVFFSFHYELNSTDLDLVQIVRTEDTIRKRLMNSVNEIADFEPLKKSGHNLGYIYNDLNGKTVISILFSVNSEGRYEYNKELSKRVQNQFLAKSKSNPSRSTSTNSNNWKNSEHGFSLLLPEGYIEEELDETNMLLNAYSASMNRRIEVVYSDDYSFKVLSNKDYAESLTKDQLLSALKVLYTDLKINIWEPQFHTKFGTLTHFVYTGNLIETGERQTSIISQFIKNGNLYTVRAICLPEDIREFHILIRDIYDTMKFER